MKYKMICTDMDGTLLTDDKKISERTENAVKAAAEKGVKVVITTLFIEVLYMKYRNTQTWNTIIKMKTTR